MPTLAQDPVLRTAAATLIPGLATFGCWSQSVYAIEVDAIAGDLAHGKYGDLPVLVAENPDSGDLQGFCVSQDKPLFAPPPFGDQPDAAYIACIGVNGPVRGHKLPDGVTSIGDHLLARALRDVRDRHGGTMPPCWAWIAPANKASHTLFERHGFTMVAPAGPGEKYDTRIRPRGLAL